MAKSHIEKRTELDNRSREEILEFIEKAARQYTPEWRFDREHPDAGTALANVFTDMYMRMLGRYNQVLQKNRIEFFNSINADVLPAVPAGGYVVFGLVNDSVDGAEIPAGMKVYADIEEGEAAFKTTEDLYAVPSKLRSVYQVSDRDDLIKRAYAAGSEEKEIHLFDLSGTNLQRHELYFCSSHVLNIRHEAEIEIILNIRGEMPLPEEMVKQLLNRENAVFEYYSSNGWEELSPVLSQEKRLLFSKNEYSPPFEKTTVGEIESFWIRCRILKNMEQFETLSYESMYLTSKGTYLAPDMINGNGIECNIVEYVPFGERFGLYNEVYFACDEALTKTGSKIDFSFMMDFVKVPLTDAEGDADIEWNWVMKKSDFKVNPEYDLTIEEVLWEYYNGSGWSRLFHDSSYSDIFTTAQGVSSQYRTMRFRCPEDMTPVLVNSRESCYIRARIIKINNLYKNKGFYVTPVLSDTVFSYDYAKNKKMPDWVRICNNLEEQTMRGGFSGENGAVRKPFCKMGLKENAVYLGFSRPLDTGPVKILFTMLENITGSHARLLWEYYGSRGFTELNPVDETESFSKTGIVTIMGMPDSRKTEIFGEDLYWLRIIDEAGYFARQTGVRQYPCITDFHMNAVKVVNSDIEETEYFAAERYEEGMQIHLLHENVIDASLWVDESGHLSERELTELREDRETQCEWSPSGVLEHAWVLWDETSDFIGTDSRSRCYCIDKNSGTITFGNGRYGRIIPASKIENIRVSYSCGGGERTNLFPGAVNRMGYSAGFVNTVTNPHRILGGSDRETLQEAVARNAGIMRNHYKAVTMEDFEQLALNASRSLRRVKCFTGYDGQGQPMAGAVTVVVLQKEFEHGRYAFNDMKEQIYRFMKDKISGHLTASGRFFVTEPEFVEICVRIEVISRELSGVFRMKKEIEQMLSAFLNPMSGHFDGGGWQIGTLPTVVQLQNLLRDVKGVRYIKSIYMSAYVTGNGGRAEVDLKKIKEHPFILPVSGTHSIVIKADQS